MFSPDASRLVAVSQRVDRAVGHGERRDALAQDWYAVFDRWGVTPVLVPNREDPDPRWLVDLGVEAVLLTGGNTPAVDGVPADEADAPERDATERALVDFARERRWPVLGVCRGAQLLASLLGARLRRVEPRGAHVATIHAITLHGARSSSTTKVNSYHDWAIDPAGLDDRVRVLATASDGGVEAFTHVDEPLLGVMWHPERPGPRDAVLEAMVAGALFGRVDFGTDAVVGVGSTAHPGVPSDPRLDEREVRR